MDKNRSMDCNSTSGLPFSRLAPAKNATRLHNRRPADPFAPAWPTPLPSPSLLSLTPSLPAVAGVQSFLEHVAEEVS